MLLLVCNCTCRQCCAAGQHSKARAHEPSLSKRRRRLYRHFHRLDCRIGGCLSGNRAHDVLLRVLSANVFTRPSTSNEVSRRCHVLARQVAHQRHRPSACEQQRRADVQSPRTSQKFQLHLSPLQLSKDPASHAGFCGCLRQESLSYGRQRRWC